ncbi:MAG: WecB/TagA/CpsF family glycosyltransferase [Opitutaceae bacterium]|nr:WecB/TagA/CpsF family glycosyltransferase [Opitutaceae bacterium]
MLLTALTPARARLSRLQPPASPVGPFFAAPAAPAAATRGWPIAILGVPFDPVTIASAVERIEAMIESGQPNYVVTPNVDFLVRSKRDPALHQILVHADLVLCDGKPLVWASQWLGNALPGRVAGSDLAPVLFQRAAERGWKIFLLGGAPGVGAEAARRIAAAHPSLPAVAHYSPPLRPLAEMNHDEIIGQLRAAKPDIVLVCFGCPKQEKWIFRNYRTVGAPVMIGAGGTVDFLAGRLRRAPMWMRRTGTESMFRLWQEPRRLFKRYADDLFRFVPALLGQLWHLPARGTRKNSPRSVSTSAPTSYGIRVEAGGQLHRDVLQGAPAFWAHTMEQPGHCLLDLTKVKSIDSTGLAFLAHWQRRLAQVQRNLILLQPSAAVRAALKRMGLTGEFVISEGPRIVPISIVRGENAAPNGKN